MKGKVGRPKNVNRNGYHAMQIRRDTHQLLVAWQREQEKILGFRINKLDIIHIAIQMLIRNGLPKS